MNCSYCRTNCPDGAGSWRSTPAAMCCCILLSSGGSSLMIRVSLDLMPTSSNVTDGPYEHISLGGKPIKTLKKEEIRSNCTTAPNSKQQSQTMYSETSLLWVFYKWARNISKWRCGRIMWQTAMKC